MTQRVAAEAIPLLCFPHAGGGAASLHGWQQRLGPGIRLVPIVPPGRESRYNEPPHRSMSTLVEALANEHRSLLQQPVALFGHSLGAVVAYEVCRRMLESAGPAPLHLFVSGRRPPHLPSRQPPVRNLPRDDLLTWMAGLNGVPPEVLADEALMNLLLPTVRADCEVHETYQPPGRHRLTIPVPVTAFMGESDPLITVGEMLSWRDVTSRRFSLRVYPGDHFYLRQARPEPLQVISEELHATAGARR